MASAEIFPGGQCRKFAYLFRLLTMQCKWKDHKTLYPFYPNSVLVEPQFSNFCLKCFLHFGYQKCFSFHKLLMSIFLSTLYKQVNLRITNTQHER